MNALSPTDFTKSETLKLIAVPKAGDPATYWRLQELQQAARALDVSITRYLNTPALPACAEYRAQRMGIVESDIADMRKVIDDA